MKHRCALCERKKARRSCLKNENEFICSQCCAEIRGEDDCAARPHFEAANRYEAEKYRQTEKHHFIIELDEEFENLVDQALELVEAGKKREGQKAIRSLYDEKPEHHVAQYAMGVCCLMNEDWDGALEYLTRSVKTFPYFVEAHFNLGEVYRKKMDLYNMVKSYQRVLECAPEDHLARETAEEIIQTFTRNEGVSVDNYLRAHEAFLEAFDHMRANRVGKAIASFKKSLRFSPNKVQPYGNMGVCHLKLGEKKKAMAAFDKALEIDPNYEVARYNKLQAESANEGEPAVLDNNTLTVECYKDLGTGGKSHARHLFDKLLERRR